MSPKTCLSQWGLGNEGIGFRVQVLGFVLYRDYVGIIPLLRLPSSKLCLVCSVPVSVQGIVDLGKFHVKDRTLFTPEPFFDTRAAIQRWAFLEAGCPWGHWVHVEIP